MSADEGQAHRRTRLYVFPGGVFEREESPGDVPGAGMYLEFCQPRQTCGDARAYGPREAERFDPVDDETEPA